MSHVRSLVVSAMLLAACVVLPLAFHSIPRAGSILLPMHVPVLLAGLTVGWKYGLIVGLLGPLLSHVFTGMPPVPVYQLMMLELGVYGLVGGLAIKFVRTRNYTLDLYISLVVAMLIGRVFAGIGQVFWFFGDGFFSGGYTWAAWVASYFTTSLPGIVIQIIFLPSLVMALEREHLIPLRYPVKA